MADKVILSRDLQVKTYLQRGNDTTTRTIAIANPKEQLSKAQMAELREQIVYGDLKDVIQPLNWRDENEDDEPWTSTDVEFTTVETTKRIFDIGDLNPDYVPFEGDDEIEAEDGTQVIGYKAKSYEGDMVTMFELVATTTEAPTENQQFTFNYRGYFPVENPEIVYVRAYGYDSTQQEMKLEVYLNSLREQNAGTSAKAVGVQIEGIGDTIATTLYSVGFGNLYYGSGTVTATYKSNP